MKYSKEFETILQSDSFPEEWRDNAIQYRKLKKLIKNVVDELESMGLNPDVLHRILRDDDGDTAVGGAPESSRAGARRRPSSFTLDAALREQQKARIVQAGPEASEAVMDEFEFEFDGDADQGQAVDRDEVEHLQGAHDGDLKPYRGKFRLRLPSYRVSAVDGQEEVDSPSTEGRHRWELRDHMTAKVKGEYFLSGPTDNPTPQIRLVLSSSPAGINGDDSVLRASSRSSQRSEHLEGFAEVTRPSSEDSDSRITTRSSTPARLPESDGDSEDSGDHRGGMRRFLPSSPRLNKIEESPSPIFVLNSGASGDGMANLAAEEDTFDLGEPALAEETPSATSPKTTEADGGIVDPGSDDIMSLGGDVVELPATSPEEREIVVSLPSDMAFFQLLCDALVSLSKLHEKQQLLFNESVQRLCALISNSITPQNTHNPIKKLHLPSLHRKDRKTADHDIAHVPGSSSYHKSDLYAWREIFTLWIEAQIFESSAERDRGERSVEAAEKRLQAFAAEVVKRGLGDRRTLRRKESRAAWEEFLRLNVLLLDLKRFQIANINAARKILKKHDKRTALTASNGFPQYVRKTLDAHIDVRGNVTTWTFYSTSLPHVLLSSLTDTLLPILPSLEDYTCLICTSIAFKPIRLSCSHLFCVRCLAKLQRAGKAECPLCRAPTVLSADRSSLDTELMSYLLQHFPLETSLKQKENEREIAMIQAKNAGLDSGCSVM